MQNGFQAQVYGELAGETLTENDLEMVIQSGEFVFSRLTRAEGVAPWLIVTPAVGGATSVTEARLRHTLNLKAHLHSAWATRPLELLHRGKNLALVLEYPGGEFLQNLIGQSIDMSTRLRISIGIVSAVGQLHERDLIHRDIRPGNLLIDAKTGEAWLTGFGLTSRLPRQRQSPDPPAVIAGTLAYMAPEQTGRMNRSTDSRSDLYSVGVTLYEMFTGTLPFTASDPMEWVHCHIAKEPIMPHERSPEVPEAVSALIMKLLAKAPEERYQTAIGVEADLRRCLASLDEHGWIMPFPLRLQDASDQLVIPEKLYGRDKEINLLLASFDRVVSEGRTELVLVSGYSGVGKSSVVNELHKALVPPRALFASGKFDQYKRDIPYATLAQALQTLVRHILTQSDAEVLRWRFAFLEAIGPNGQLITKLVPELELIIGVQPEVVDLPPQEAQGRFQMVFRRVIGVFARPEHPLALFLDDLQWLDTATLALLQHLVTHNEVRHLLLIGAYRENEVGLSHPLMQTLDAINKAATPVHHIVLANLCLDDVTHLLVDALHCSREKVRSLAQVVHQKSGGNPFFANQFITNLEEERLLTYAPEAAAWKWDVGLIQAKGFTENVVDLMVGKLTRLPAATQDALRQLACLGDSASIETLTAVYGRSEETLQADLWEAVRLGLALRHADTYSFVHDRVQEAAYVTIPTHTRPAQHLRIGRLLAAITVPEKVEERIFDIVNQLNRGIELITLQEDREDVAGLNLLAGRRAKASTAYAAARGYLAAGCDLLSEESWDRCYPLAFELKLQHALCEVLSANVPAAEALIAEAMMRAQTKVDLGAAYCLRVDLHVMKDEHERAIAVALEYLQVFGITMSAHPERRELDAMFQKVWRKVETRPIESLIELPLIRDPEIEAAMTVLSAMCPPALFTDEILACLPLCHLANLSLENGTSGASAFAFGLFGIMLGHFYGRYEEGYRFGTLARALVERHGFAAYDAKTYYSLEMVSVWTRPLNHAVEAMRECHRAANESGDLTYACFSLNHGITDMLTRGDHLDAVWDETVRALAFVRAAKMRDVADVIVTQQRMIQNLRGRTKSILSFDDDEFLESEFEAQLGTNRMATMVCWYWLAKGQMRFIYGAADEAVKYIELARPLLWSCIGHLQWLDFHLFAGLAHAAAQPSGAESSEALKWRKQLSADCDQLGVWAASCPETFADKHLVVKAEIARIEGRNTDAEQLFREAVELAKKNGFVQYEAIASEVAARFHMALGSKRTAQQYIRRARDCYERWGAPGKVHELDELYPPQQEPTIAFPSLAIDKAIEQLDLTTVLKMSQALSEEILINRLIERLMILAVEHAGAVRGLLVLRHNDQFVTGAEAMTIADAIRVSIRDAAPTSEDIPESILRYVGRSQDSVLLNDALLPNQFSLDPYFESRRPRSVVCLPLVKQARLIGVLYLENHLSPSVFTPARIAVLQLLAAQAAISLENAHLYTSLQQAEDKAKRSELELQLAIDSIPAFAWSTGPDGSNEKFNKQWHDYTGISTEMASGGGWAVSFHPEDLPHVRAVWARALAFGIESEVEARIQHRSGDYRRFLVRGQPIRDESGAITKWYGTNTDIEDLKQAETLLAGEKDLLEMIATGETLPVILDALCRLAEKLLVGSLGAVLLMDLDGKRLRHGAAPSLPVEYTNTVDGALISPAAGSCGTAAYHGKSVSVSDISSDPLWSDFRHIALAHGLRACCSTPILSSGGKVLGTFALYSPEPRQFTNRERGIAEQFTHLASIVIERKRADDALTKSEALLSEGQRISHTGSWAWDVSSNHLTWSEEHCRIFGFPITQMETTLATFIERVHPKDRRMVETTLKRAASTESEFSCEYRIVLPDGLLKHVHSSGRPVVNDRGDVDEFIGIAMDITERHLARAALEDALTKVKESESELRTIIEAIPTHVWCALPDGSTAYQNQRWLDYVGLTSEIARGWGWRQTIHPDDVEQYVERWMEITRTNVSGEAEARFRRFDGVYRWFLMRVVPVVDEQGNIVRWYGTNTDVDDLKNAQSALTASEQLARGQVEALVQSLDVLATAPDPDQLIVQMLGTIGRLLKSRWVTLWLLDPAHESLVLRANVRDSAEVPPDGHPYVNDRSAWKADIALKELFFTREPVVCEDLESDMRLPATVREFFRTHGIKKLLRLPTLVGGEVKGFITIGHGKRGPYSATEVELAQALAHQAMLALQTGQAATLEERNRMARDIHDTLAQGFTAVIIQLQAAEDAKSKGLETDCEEHLKRARDLARYSLNEARRSVRALRPQALEDTTVWDALKRLIKNATAGTKLRAHFRLSGEPRELPPLHEAHLLYIGQEALTNTLKYAHASNFTTLLSFSDHEVRLELQDDGCGFAMGEPHDGAGLVGMRERAAKIGGLLEIWSTPAGGTRIAVITPMLPQSPALVLAPRAD